MVDKLSNRKIDKKKKVLSLEWKLVDGRLKRRFKLDDFKTALFLTVKIGGLAEKQNHHPVITLSWGEVVVEIWTHEIDGLTEKDFKLAKAIDEIG